jgi:hypothetical protein
MDKDTIMRAIRVANLWNGLANRRGSRRIARHAALWAEKVVEMHAELPPMDAIWFRLPDPDDQVVPAHSVEYPRYFPLQMGSTTARPDTIIPNEDHDHRRQWLAQRVRFLNADSNWR